MAIVIDESFSALLSQKKQILDQLKIEILSLKNNFQNLPVKERVRQHASASKKLSDLKLFLSSVQKSQILNAGQKFTFENIENSLRSQLELWKKIEKLMDSTGV